MPSHKFQETERLRADRYHGGSTNYLTNNEVKLVLWWLAFLIKKVTHRCCMPIGPLLRASRQRARIVLIIRIVISSSLCEGAGEEPVGERAGGESDWRWSPLESEFGGDEGGFIGRPV